MTLDQRLAALLTPHHAESKRMFGGTCFMVNGNMVIGTLKDGLLVRVGKEKHGAAMKLPGARVFDMTGRPMEGFISVEGSAVATDKALGAWVELGLAFVKTLPAKSSKKPARKMPAKKKR